MNDASMFLESNDKIGRFLKVAYMTLGSTGFVPLQRLEGPYMDMGCSMHENAAVQTINLSTLKYVVPRLPRCIFRVTEILFGQSETFLYECGVPLESWTEVFASARRRRYLYDGDQRLVAFMASKSDFDDVLPTLLALQIEWNKIHRLIRNDEKGKWTSLEEAQLNTLKELFGSDFDANMAQIASHRCDISIKNYEASYCRYRKETETWWKHINNSFPDIENRPVYFVSSNTHSLINVISGFTESISDEILGFAKENAALAPLYYKYIDETTAEREKEYILYYLQMKYEASREEVKADVTKRRIAWEKDMGIMRISSTKTLDVTTQIIDLATLSLTAKDKKTGIHVPDGIHPDALILNIDYPLGRTAYFILNKIAEHIDNILGVYVIGKAASLFADRGDILIPSYIADQHTQNQYYFNNCVCSDDLIAFLGNEKHGVYDNQKAVTVLGTFLQNREMLNDLLMAGITDLEMEAGPYLSALYEITHAKRYPENETIMLDSVSPEIGIIHYVSDNPMSSAKLDSSLATDGIDATYASTLVVLDKIFEKEAGRAKKNNR